MPMKMIRTHDKSSFILEKFNDNSLNRIQAGHKILQIESMGYQNSGFDVCCLEVVCLNYLKTVEKERGTC